MLGFGPLGAHTFGEAPSFVELWITSTATIQKPIDYVIEWERNLAAGWREFDKRAHKTVERAVHGTGSVKKLSGGKPSFTTTTSKRGYD